MLETWYQVYFVPIKGQRVKSGSPHKTEDEAYIAAQNQDLELTPSSRQGKHVVDDVILKPKGYQP